MDATSPRPLQPFSQFERIALARQIIQDEARALGGLAGSIPAGFDDAVNRIMDCSGALLVMGIGKAGWVGQKLSATFASTGTPSHFLHPAEAIHGDLGRISSADQLLILSNSGATEEITRLLPMLKRRDVPIMAITASDDSPLGKAADIVLTYGSTREACPLGLAPSTTTAVMLALGDALALVVSQARGFGSTDFVQFHPGGSLGRKLSRVEEVMRPLSDCRLAEENETVREAYVRLSGPTRRSGAIMVVDAEQRLTGIFTDSDLARLLERQHDGAFDSPIAQVMTADPATVSAGQLLTAALDQLADRNLSELPVTNDDRHPLGMIDVTDLIGLVE